MIKFFRTICKKLIEEDNVRKYLLYAIGEIMLVVIGILIALRRLQDLTISRFDKMDDGGSDITQRLSTLIGSTTLPPYSKTAYCTEKMRI